MSRRARSDCSDDLAKASSRRAADSSAPARGIAASGGAAAAAVAATAAARGALPPVALPPVALPPPLPPLPPPPFSKSIPELSGSGGNASAGTPSRLDAPLLAQRANSEGDFAGTAPRAAALCSPSAY